MRVELAQALLALAVLSAWLGAAGFARLVWPLDRLHCVTFVNVTCGASILIAATLWGGSPDDVSKLALLLGALLVGGAAIAHATARAIVRRRAPR
ncbi:MAG TPA: monovalent cation/H(+) antiporter subunit G [Steroidobacteraceae bacterium]|nr:monovalent cation/H(+) antiporter subunit G [Steroidobacteraceae bacterium]